MIGATKSTDTQQFASSHRGFHMRGAVALSPEIATALTSLFEITPSERPISVLGGRGAVTFGELPGIGRVVVKHYSRGGWLRHLISHFYLRLGAYRAQTEFELLSIARVAGVNAPEPLFWAYKGGLIYRTWLVTREIKNKHTLAELSLLDEERTSLALKRLTEQVQRMIENHIFHVDLHPGNVLVDDSGAVFIIDFDKASQICGSRNALRDSYLTRWRRAVIKHSLPEIVSEGMCLGLRKQFDD